MNTIPSPCILVCSIEQNSGHCFGCGRTRDEIADWMSMSGEKRLQLMRELPERVARLERRPRRETRRSRLSAGRDRQTVLPE
jgi:predicted Fe-S protein YdhL (DUF1289 family)